MRPKFSYPRYQGRQKQSKNRNWWSLRWRQDSLSFLHSFSAGFNYSRHFGFFEFRFRNLYNLNTLIFVSSTYRVYFIIFFLKSTVFSIKKEPFCYEKKNGLLFIILRLVIEQGMGSLVDVLSSVCVVHGVEMHACYILRYQVHNLVYGIGKSCCSEWLRVILILV